MYACARSALCPQLSVRAAKVEDFDDLVPIFSRQSDVLRQRLASHHLATASSHPCSFGPFFLNDVIAGQNASNRALVADVQGTARGFISVSTDINTAVLRQCFELDVFDGLQSARQVLKPGTSVCVDVHVFSHLARSGL